MSSFFYPWLLNHLWQSTLCAGVTALLALMLRENSAANRYRLWLAASVKFLIPFSLLVTLGNQLNWRSPAPAPASAMSPIRLTEPIVAERDSSPDLLKRVTEPLTAMVPEPAPWPRRILIAAFSIWLAGLAFNVASWVHQWRRVRARLRTASPLELDVPALIPAVSSPASIEPSVFGIFRPVLLLPENITRDLTPDQIEAILLHESEHVYRRDNLGAVLHMVVEAIFWFNPIVWWIGKRLAEERERACDEQVLRGFDDPEVYAEAILNVCKLHLQTPLACMAGVASSNLRERIERIMNHRKPLDLNAGRKIVLASVAVAIACGPLLVGMTIARQLPSASARSEGSFSFVSIDVPGAISTSVRGIDSSGRVVGSFIDSSGTHGFLFSNGTFSKIDVPGSTWNIATGINSAGQIVGGYGTGTDSGNHGFLYSAGNFSTFDAPGSLDTIGYGLNNKGQIVGTFLGSDGFRHGFRLSGGNYATVEVPESHSGSAESINDEGQIVGLSGYGAAATGFLYNGNSFVKIQSTPNVYAVARGLNNLGDIVGQDGGPQAPFRGFLRNGTRYTSLELPGDPFSWNATGINDLGQIVGEFSDRQGKTHGYLATPTVFKSAPTRPSASPPSNLLTGINDSGALRGTTGPRGPRRQPDSPGPGGPAQPEAGNRGRGGVPGNDRDLNALRNAFERTANSIRRSDEDDAFAKRALAAVLLAVDDVTAAIAFMQQHPEAASAPLVPPKITPEFALPEALRGSFPGRQVTLNALKEDFELLNKTYGGDLGGLRAKIHGEIATAAKETIADIIHEQQARDFNVLRGALQRANNNLRRVNTVYAQRAQAAVTQAIEDVAAVLTFIVEHPSARGAPTPTVTRPEFAPATADRGRYPSRETALANLASAFDLLVRVPGDDFGGLRSRIQSEITTAAGETLADIRESAQRESEERRAAEAKAQQTESKPPPR